MKHARLRRLRRIVALAAGAALLLACTADRTTLPASDSANDNGGDGNVSTPGDPGSSDVRFTLDATKTHPISPFIYGVNEYAGYPSEWNDGIIPPWPKNLRLSRVGGNRWTAYNWENNASNAGNDASYSNDGWLGGGDTPGEAVRTRVAASRAAGAGILITVPMIGYVAKDKSNVNVGASEDSLAARLATHFVKSVPKKGAAFAYPPSTGDDAVYQDEFIWWLNQQFPGAATDPTTPLFVSLDNEPDIWYSTHEEIRSKVNGRDNLTGYDELVQLTIAYASAIKSQMPGVQVFGPALATWNGDVNLYHNSSPDPAGRQFFLDYYLDKLHAAETAQGRRLVDVLDLHWYPAAGTSTGSVDDDNAAQTPEMIQARLQAPRSLWDPTYVEGSWVSDVTQGPIRLIPRLKESIAAHYPGTKIAITEYYYGRGGDISGGLAQADVLGIFGREGVFAATLWPNANIWASPYGGNLAAAYAYVNGAFRMFRDYDGQQHAFGDIGIQATTSDVATTSVYASVDAADPTRVIIVAINKTDASKTASITLTAQQQFSVASVYTMTDGSPNPTHQSDVPITKRNAFVYTMPSMSVSTLVLHN